MSQSVFRWSICQCPRACVTLEFLSKGYCSVVLVLALLLTRTTTLLLKLFSRWNSIQKTRYQLILLLFLSTTVKLKCLQLFFYNSVPLYNVNASNKCAWYNNNTLTQLVLLFHSFHKCQLPANNAIGTSCTQNIIITNNNKVLSATSAFFTYQEFTCNTCKCIKSISSSKFCKYLNSLTQFLTEHLNFSSSSLLQTEKKQCTIFYKLLLLLFI